MKKDESQKINSVKDRGNVKNEGKIQGPTNHISKPFLGCDTCKMKNSISLRKSKAESSGKLKKNENCSNQNEKIKMIDLCDEDKRRIIELMEELARFVEENRSLKELLDNTEKAKQEQNDCLVKQTNLHLEEKNMFLKEIQTYKARLETYEMEMKEKMTNWEEREKSMDKEIRYLAKALQKTFDEKSDLVREIGHLKSCLKQSLESFELLRNEVMTLQRLSRQASKPSLVPRCPTIAEEKRELIPRPEEPEEDFLSTTKDTIPAKGSLGIINSKLEQLYTLLQNKSVGTDKTSPSKRTTFNQLKIPEEVELDSKDNEIFPSDALSEAEENKTQNEIKRNAGVAKMYDTGYKFLKPFSGCDKTSVQAERILKKIEKPFFFHTDNKSGRDNAKDEDSGRRLHREKHFKTEEDLTESASSDPTDRPLDEDRLLSELFYSYGVVDLGLESVLLSLY